MLQIRRYCGISTKNCNIEPLLRGPVYVIKDQSFWNIVLWSDETKIRMEWHKGRMRVWRNEAEEFSYECSRPTSQGFSGGLMIWGCMSVNGPGPCYIFDNNMNSKLYLEVLKECLIRTGRSLCGNNFVFMQDNARIHTAKLVKEWFAENGIEALQWPPQSPDLNPIENAWSMPKIKV